jgi:hypothetical protein
LFSNKRVYFITKHSSVKITQRSDVILSPEFYWVIKKNLPVKTVFQAKKLCDSLFDSMLPSGEYQYKVVKKGEEFLLFAYDHSYILKTLQKIGLNINLIDNIYFAQNELLCDVAYEVDDRALICKDGIFTILPKNLLHVQTKKIEEITFEKLSNIKIPIDKYSLFLDKKVYNFLMIALMLFISFEITEAFIYKISLDKNTKLKENFYKKYNLPSTSWQIEAIKKRLKTQHETQLSLRESIGEILGLKLKKGEYFEKINLSKKGISFTLAINDDKRAVAIKNQLKNNFNILKAVVKEKRLNMELSYAKN